MEVQRAFGRFGFFADPGEGAALAGRLHAFFAEAGYGPAVH